MQYILASLLAQVRDPVEPCSTHLDSQVTSLMVYEAATRTGAIKVWFKW